MGRGGFKRHRGGNRRRDGGRDGGSQPAERYHKPYAEIVKENDKLQRYYNGLLGLDGNEAEREAFWAAFRRELPHSFRFCGSKGHALAVQKLLQTRYIPELAKMTQYDGLPVAPPQPVPWYPDNLAWWMTTSKTVIRKFPPFAAFQKFLVSETTVGNISRQEVVSMIPPLLLDVRPGMAVLDLCAAPGSKAAQLLEMVHQGEEARVRKVLRSLGAGGEGRPSTDTSADDDDDNDDPAARLAADPSDDGRATGILVANDADYKRSHLLVHQLKRLSSPNIIVTNHDATVYPSLRLPPLPDDPRGAAQPVRYLKFDRILADVPCSGDGTLRKNVTMWKDWNPGNALGLHLVQVRILVRALQMLKPGGRVVYSTCSLNPVENEAVVAAAIAQCGGPDKVDLLDSSDQLPQLQRRPGLKRWQIMDKAGRLWSSWAEVEAFTAAAAATTAEEEAKRQADGNEAPAPGGGNNNNAGVAPSKVVPTMFASEETDRLPLERCLRVYPHLQDTGGFFIVVLQKKGGEAVEKPKATPAPAPAPVSAAPAGKKRERGEGEEQEEGAGDAEAADAEPSKKRKQEETGDKDDKTDKAAAATATPATPAPAAPVAAPRRKYDGPYEEPFKYLAADHPVVREIQAFYHLSPRFPSDRFLVRNATGEPAKAIYYTSGLVRDILASNSSDALSGNGGGGGSAVKFVHGGVRMFVKQEAPSADVCRWRIQAEGLPLLAGYVGPARVVRLHRRATLRVLLTEMFPKFADAADAARLGEVGEALPALGMGCFVLQVEPEAEPEADADAADAHEVPLEPMALPLWKSFQSLNLMLPKEDRAAMLLRIFNDTTPLVNNALSKKKADAAADTAADAATPSADPAATPQALPEAGADAGDDAMAVDEYDAEDAPSS